MAEKNDITCWEQAQETLERVGVVVISSPLVDPVIRAETRAGFKQHLRESPEFRDPNPDDPTWKPQLGGFAAMGNPSSFHHPFVRKLREMCTATVLDADVLPLHGRMLEKPFDRLMYRVAGEKPSAESMHRDEAKTAKDGDTVFGGWANLDDAPQSFSCAPYTHMEVGNQNHGFALIKSKEQQERYRPLFRRVTIPPGCILIFYERIVHEVVSKKATALSMRIMLGWRATNSNEPLFTNHVTLNWIHNQAVPRIKSGQKPCVYPSNYPNFPKNYKKLTEWSIRTYKCLYTHTVGGSGEFAGTQWIRVQANMLSLRECGLPMHPPYDAHEIRLLMPQREWMLYAFDSPTVRIGFRAVTIDAWNAYLHGKCSAPPDSTVLRPRPERVVQD